MTSHSNCEYILIRYDRVRPVPANWHFFSQNDKCGGCVAWYFCAQCPPKSTSCTRKVLNPSPAQYLTLQKPGKATVGNRKCSNLYFGPSYRQSHYPWPQYRPSKEKRASDQRNSSIRDNWHPLTSLPTAWLLCYLHRTNTRMEKKRRLATSQCYSQVWFYIYHFISIRRKGGVQKTDYQSLSTSSTALATWANDPNGPRNCPSLQLSELLHYTLTRMHQTPTCLDVLLTWPPGQQQVSDAFTRAPIK